jgi:hypothetical protein
MRAAPMIAYWSRCGSSGACPKAPYARQPPCPEGKSHRPARCWRHLDRIPARGNTGTPRELTTLISGLRTRRPGHHSPVAGDGLGRTPAPCGVLGHLARTRSQPRRRADPHTYSRTRRDKIFRVCLCRSLFRSNDMVPGQSAADADGSRRHAEPNGTPMHWFGICYTPPR